MRLPEIIIARRTQLALAWLGAAVLFLPAAAGVSRVLEVGATVEGSESAAVEQLLRGPLASAYARYAILVVRGTPAPTTPEGDTVLTRLVTDLASAAGVSGVFSFRDGRDSLFLAPHMEGTFIVVGLARTAAPDIVIPRLRTRTALIQHELRARYPGVTLRWTGEGALNHDLRQSSNADVGRAERRALPVIAVFLLLAFGAVAAALVPVTCGA